MKLKFGLYWDRNECPDPAVEMCKTQFPYTKTIKSLNDEKAVAHRLIEGDNFHALSVMAAKGEKVDIIYIDPPYNTGNEFTYNDKWKSTEWLTFMEHRMKLAHRLLKDDGICYISIGDDELANLTLLCDQVFGRQNRITTISRITKKGGNQGLTFSPACDYILVYSLAPELLTIGKTREEDEQKYISRADVIVGSDARPNQRYWVECPDGSFIIPKGNNYPEKITHLSNVASEQGETRWVYTHAKFKEEQLKGNITFKKVKSASDTLVDQNFNPSPWRPVITKHTTALKKVRNFLVDQTFTNEAATKDLKELFGKKVFDFPKPTALIKHLIEITNKPKDITVLDFFAGSGSTAHAVMDMNAADGGRRKSIMCAINGLEGEINDICTNVTYKRMELVIDKIIKERKQASIMDSDDFPPCLVHEKIEFIPYDGSDTNMFYNLEDKFDNPDEVIKLYKQIFKVV